MRRCPEAAATAAQRGDNKRRDNSRLQGWALGCFINAATVNEMQTRSEGAERLRQAGSTAALQKYASTAGEGWRQIRSKRGIQGDTQEANRGLRRAQG